MKTPASLPFPVSRFRFPVEWLANGYAEGFCIRDSVVVTALLQQPIYLFQMPPRYLINTEWLEIRREFEA